MCQLERSIQNVAIWHLDCSLQPFLVKGKAPSVFTEYGAQSRKGVLRVRFS